MPPERTGGATLELKGLVKRYPDCLALDDVSLEVRAGEFLTLLGPSGSGKTTTLNLVAGFDEPTAGSVSMDGRPLDDVPAHRRNIGVVFQHYALFPHMTAAENVAFPLRRRRLGKDEIGTRVETALARVQLRQMGSRRPSELSGGQQQRVALARAIVFEPRLLLMDEPLGALDKKLRETLQLEIRRLHRDLGITFVFVTHDQDEALVLSDRIAIFKDGCVQQVGTATDLYERPRTRFVAEFIGESNVFAGVLSRDNGSSVLRTEGYELTAPDAELPAGPAVLVVRPERLRVVPGDAPQELAGNVVEGVVRDVIYLGNARKIQVRLPDGSVTTIRESTIGASALTAGQAVRVMWRVDDSILLAG